MAYCSLGSYYINKLWCVVSSVTKDYYVKCIEYSYNVQH